MLHNSFINNAATNENKMTKTDIEQIKNKATKLMNDYKSVLATEELALSKLSEEEQLNEMFFGDKPTSNELVLMREYFRLV